MYAAVFAVVSLLSVVYVVFRRNKPKPRLETSPVATVKEENDPENVGLFSLLAENMKAVLKDMGPWSVGALTFGLLILQEKHEEEGARDVVKGKRVKDKEQLSSFLRDVNIAYAAYCTDHEKLWKDCADEEVEVLMECLTPEPFCPAHFIGIDHQNKSVLLVIRGTSAIHDLLTDISGSFVDNGCGGQSHFGITESAKGLLKKTQPFLLETLKKHEGYSLKLIGHSLGAGAGSLLCFMINNREDLKEEFGGLVAKCVGIASPPILTRDQAISCKDHVTTLVMENDVVARASIANFEQLRREIQSTRWEEKVKGEVENRLKQAFDVPESMKAKVQEKIKKIKETLENDEKVKEAARLHGLAASYLSELRDSANDFLNKSSQFGKEFFSKMGIEPPKMSTGDEIGDPGASTSDIKEEAETAEESNIAPTNPLKLYCPGQIIFLAREPGEEGIEKYSAVSSIRDRFERIVLHRKMVSDHFLDAYQQALKAVIAIS